MDGVPLRLPNHLFLTSNSSFLVSISYSPLSIVFLFLLVLLGVGGVEVSFSGLSAKANIR